MGEGASTSLCTISLELSVPGARLHLGSAHTPHSDTHLGPPAEILVRKEFGVLVRTNNIKCSFETGSVHRLPKPHLSKTP